MSTDVFDVVGPVWTSADAVPNVPIACGYSTHDRIGNFASVYLYGSV